MSKKHKKRILIVEDDETLSGLLAEALGDEGFSVLLAKDGKAGLRLALNEHPDLILLDLVLPQMGGLALFNKLMGDDWGREVPIIVLTNLGDPKDVVKGLGKGVNEYLVKSDWKLEDVVKKVKTQLGV